jgi:hypothetical protein
MHRSEEALQDICASCGAEVLSLERIFAFETGDDEPAVLCAACAMARGGQYEELHDRWVRAPDVTDLVGSRE